jgi:hypothetical protein
MTEEKTTIENEIREALEINSDDIITELTEQPSQYYYYGCGWAMAARKRRLLKMKLKETEAELGNEFKQKVYREDPKLRVTERMLDDQLSQDSRYQEAFKNLIQAEYTESVFEVAKDAFKERYGALVELSKNNKEEKFYGNEIKIMKDEMERRDEKVTKRNKRISKPVETEWKEGE